MLGFRVRVRVRITLGKKGSELMQPNQDRHMIASNDSQQKESERWR